jgi:hypothetical protein
MQGEAVEGSTGHLLLVLVLDLLVWARSLVRLS